MMLLDHPGLFKMRACFFSPVYIMPIAAPFVKFSSDTLVRLWISQGAACRFRSASPVAGQRGNFA